MYFVNLKPSNLREICFDQCIRLNAERGSKDTSKTIRSRQAVPIQEIVHTRVVKVALQQQCTSGYETPLRRYASDGSHLRFFSFTWTLGLTYILRIAHIFIEKQALTTACSKTTKLHHRCSRIPLRHLPAELKMTCQEWTP